MTHRCERISAAVGIEQADGDDRLAEESSHACDVVTPAPIERCVHQNIGSNPIVTGTESTESYKIDYIGIELFRSRTLIKLLMKALVIHTGSM
jgi:hypothetical protein